MHALKVLNFFILLFLLCIQWDEKITTLPGLYIISIGIINPLMKWTGQWLCTTNYLRLINLLLVVLTLPIFHKITKQIHGDKHVSFKSNYLSTYLLQVDLKSIEKNCNYFFCHIFSTLMAKKHSCRLHLWEYFHCSTFSPSCIIQTLDQLSWLC